MDIYNMYMGGDTYNTMRNPVFRDYEQFPYGTIEGSPNSRKTYYAMVQEKKEQHKFFLKKGGKTSCPFCAEHKKKPLGTYLRKRQLSTRDEKICEEEEEECNINEEEDDECHEKHEHVHQYEHKETDRREHENDNQNQQNHNEKLQTKPVIVSSF